MDKIGENMEWESEAPNLAKLTKCNPFKVPSNYFDDLSERTNMTIYIEQLNQKTTEGFSVPADYFEHLSPNINTQIALEKYKSTPNFKVPNAYFETLTENIAKKTKKPKTIKIWHQPLFKYAVAACLVLAPATGWFANRTYQEKQIIKSELAKEQMLYNIDEDVIFEYLGENYSEKSTPTTNEMESYILDHFSSQDLSNNL